MKEKEGGREEEEKGGGGEGTEEWREKDSGGSHDFMAKWNFIVFPGRSILIGN